MSMDNNDALESVARGGAIFALGTMAGSFLQFIVGVTVIRLIAKSEFGLLAVANVLATAFALFSTLGFGIGVPRFISKFRARKNDVFVAGTTWASLFISGGVAVILSFLLGIGAKPIASFINKPEIFSVLRAFAFIIPPFAIIQILTAIFRGREQTAPKVVFQDVGLYAVRLLLLLSFMIIDWGFKGVLVAYVGSVWIAFLLYLGYAFRNQLAVMPMEIDWRLSKELVTFSAPLLAMALFGMLLGWAGTLTLGYFQASEEVGLFNASLRLATLLALPLNAIAFLYLPVATGLFENALSLDLRQLYESSTKWAFLFTLPLLLIFVLDAKFVVTFLFGKEYVGSAIVLQCLALGFSVQALLGPTGITLVSDGRNKEVFVFTLIGTLSVIALCLILVPRQGAIGAAISTSMAMILSNLLRSISLIYHRGIHPFSWQYVKPISFTVVASVLAYITINKISPDSLLFHSVFFVSTVLVALSSPFLTRSMSRSDMSILRSFQPGISRRTSSSVLE